MRSGATTPDTRCPGISSRALASARSNPGRTAPDTRYRPRQDTRSQGMCARQARLYCRTSAPSRTPGTRAIGFRHSQRVASPPCPQSPHPRASCTAHAPLLVLRTLSERLTLLSGVYTRGTDDFSGISLVAGLSCHLSARDMLAVFGSCTDSDLGQDEKRSVSYRHEF